MTALTKADIVDYLIESKAKQAQLDRSQIKLLVDAFFDIITLSLENNKDVKLSGFGRFKINKKKQRPGRNPKTGKETLICARNTVTFHAGDKLKKQIESIESKKS